jgi:16S rRNA (cytidine1402-2'-O)-methyltransferase
LVNPKLHSEGMKAEQGKGVLFVVATPLGNLKDITLRALEVLGTADLVAAEDTRRTLKLLSAYDLHPSLTSFHENNKSKKIPYLLGQLQQGARICLVTDGGTPGISDPGKELVRECHDSRIAVTAIPGPSAVTAALSVSGFAGEAFVFLGFLPRRRIRRRRILEKAAAEEKTLILFEAPHRLISLLGEIREIMGDRRVLVAREMTKLHEELLRGSLSDLMEELGRHPRKGEVTLLVAGEESKGNIRRAEEGEAENPHGKEFSD